MGALYVMAQIDDANEAVRNVLDILARKKFVYDTVLIPRNYVSKDGEEDVIDAINDMVDFLPKKESDIIWEELYPLYTGNPLPPIEIIQQLRYGMITGLTKIVSNTLRGGRLPLYIDLTKELDYTKGKATTTPIPLVVLDYDVYYLEVLFLRDRIRERCLLTYRIHFPYTTLVTFLSKLFTADARKAMLADLSDRRLIGKNKGQAVLQLFDKRRQANFSEIRPLYVLGFKAVYTPNATEFVLTVGVDTAQYPNALKNIRENAATVLETEGFAFYATDEDDDDSMFTAPPSVHIAHEQMVITVSAKNIEIVSDILAERFFNLLKSFAKLSA